MNAPQIPHAGIHLVENKGKAINHPRRRGKKDPAIDLDVLGMARRTRSLIKTSANLDLRQAQVIFQMALQLADVVFGAVDGTGAPLIRRRLHRATVLESRRNTEVAS